MFQLGDRVVYGIHGVCSIIDIEHRMVNKSKTEYYVLSPLEQPDSRFYIPVHNEIAVAKLRPVLTREELEALLHSEEAVRNTWIPDENQRKQRYRELITSGDRVALICMVRSLYRHKQEQIASGRKFHLCDENFMRDAQKLLSSEFSLVLGISQEQVGAYIKSILDT